MWNDTIDSTPAIQRDKGSCDAYYCDAIVALTLARSKELLRPLSSNKLECSRQYRLALKGASLPRRQGGQ